MEKLVANVPPLLQLLIVAALGAYAAISIAARVRPALAAKVFDADRNPGSRDHFIQYTVVPALIFGAVCVVVITSWDSSVPLLGTWSVARMTTVVALFVYAVAASIAGSVLAKKLDLSNARSIKAWLPLLLMVTAIGAIVTSFLLAV